VIRRGIPQNEITSLARELEVDLIAIGQGSRSGPRRSLIGSVAARVVEYAPCPVLVVKSSTSR
jgi:nucleotide-binding universal stress UspA family protein